ncbi:homogentisate 1,2-dioxygenase [Planotetraspora kaengkrachanensis]|uniref:Homogentisate 1,2-dioxygenase n=1 Tax=Planotetraspora kaengkrachanensis TaxID=575193 RepID=A0A8J3PUJ2_9ACTN|nr:homogentisate 1,2-dioxygenase domain-containing protein [Planotetraspora kaengkrachanensis]GIG81300.1 homogentisate 1,2-dioxygenase [Planotetraspora kaengkrachanensis]
MPYYRVVGEVPDKRHVQFRRPDGGLYQEELMGEEGFSSDSSLLYHRYAPTAIVKAEAVDQGAQGLNPNLPLSPRHFRTQDLRPDGDLVSGRLLLAGNSDVRISYAATSAPSELYRDSMGDECVYIASGRARFESAYGAMEVGEGDYIVVPTGAIHRWVPDGPVTALVIEAAGHIRPPKRYLSQYGQFLEHAPYSERDLRAPTEPLLVDGEEVAVLVRTRGGLTRLTYANHPFDVVGWDGCLYPYVFNIRDFEPIVKRTHAPPPVHQTFEGPGFVICSFCPRPLDFHPEAVPIPYNHHNVDSDEFMFYAGGDYSARKGSGIDVGSVSLHPAGFTHGPQPGAVEAVVEAVRKGLSTTSEMAVMLDTFRPLDLGPAALACEDPGYAWTWAVRT